MYRVSKHDGLWLVGSKEFDHEVGVFGEPGEAEAVAREMNIQAGEWMGEMLFKLKLVGGYHGKQAAEEAKRAWKATWEQKQANATC